MHKLTRNDWIFIAVCTALAVVALFVINFYSEAAFPEASIDFKFDRDDSQKVAETLLRSQQLSTEGMKHAALFDSDGQARIFLERSLGLEAANQVMRRDVHLWTWHHRWFRPLEEEELSVDVAPDGALVAFSHRIPEARAIATPAVEDARRIAETFLTRAGVRIGEWQLVSQSERKLPKRTQRIFTWEAKNVRPAGAPYRTSVTVDGNLVTRYGQNLDVPDAWLRSYSELRSKNGAAGQIDTVLMVVTIIAALVIFIIRLRRGDLHLRFLLFIGGVALLLVTFVTLNSWPQMLANYDTRDSWPSFLGQAALQVLVQGLGTAMFLIVICGAGEVLYRQRLPKQLAIPRLWNRRALASKQLFRSLILGYALVPVFIAYQVVFYVVAQKFGAWSPAQVPYDDTLNSALPWAAVLFAGFFPAFSEEFLSRAFSIPFFQRFVKSRFAAIVIAGFLWGFGHAMYPNQPFYIRGLEVGLAGVVLGFLMDRYGLLALLVWHYTVDAIYTALLLFRSGNVYYVTSAGLASLIFAVPLFISIALYLRNKGFVPDDDLRNDSLPLEPVPQAVEKPAPVAPLPPPIPVTRRRVAICFVLLALAAATMFYRPATIDDQVDFRIDKAAAIRIATRHLRTLGEQPPSHVVAVPRAGFRSWDANAGSEEGGSATSFDDVAATHLVQQGLDVEQLGDLALWGVRFYTPQEKREYILDVDARTGRVAAYHKYQEQKNAGARLEQTAAVAIATRALPAYGIDANRYVLQEALSFQQPNRRDWLLHFQERTPFAFDAYRRASVRVQGDAVTHVVRHIKIPESVYREVETRTFLTVVLFLLKVAGVIALMALVVTGFIVATRRGHTPWKRALRWTLLLSILPILGAVSRWDWSLFGYSTAVAWSTFRVNLATELVMSIGWQVAALFVAIAGAASLYSYAFSLPKREARARFGRDAVLAALTAIAAFVVLRTVLQFLTAAFPSMASVGNPDIPSEVALPWPALFVTAQAFYSAVVLAGAVALYAVAVRSSQKPRLPMLITVIGVFCAVLDAGSTPAQAPLAFVRALLIAGAVWVIARYVLRDNPLAWPLTAFLVTVLGAAATLLHQHRPDLQANAVALGVVAVTAVALMWLPRPRGV
ncbi:MAG TPA: CPBP family intramembrane glutamic endopeptidase [Thermoanaerobaculia bacterium]|jgi:membrane protease YdiL (CAAX protease family)